MPNTLTITYHYEILSYLKQPTDTASVFGYLSALPFHSSEEQRMGTLTIRLLKWMG
jgi:hypothetical protein